MLQLLLLDVLSHLLCLLAYLYAAASVRVLPRLHNPKHLIPAIFRLVFLILHEILVLIFGAIPDMEGKGHVVEDVILLIVAELFHVVEEVLLVGQQPVVLDMVMG